MRSSRRCIWRGIPHIVLRNSADLEDHQQMFPVIGFIKIEPSGSFFFFAKKTPLFMKGDGNIMLTYLLVGVIFQIIIVIERTVIRNVVSFEDIKELSKHFLFWVGFISAAIINVIAWPLAIVIEAYCIGAEI